ncbi:transcription antitermination factor NusB, partial [Flavihumibacter sediminis]|nr:transcription antitermination factor NusB [Flavihumibacter sediminis]
RLLQKQFDQTRQLLTYILHFITEVARYAETDARNRASKHLPSAADLEVNTRIAGNQLLWKILEDTSLKAALEDDKVERFLDKELVRKTYLELVTTPEYEL